MPIDGFDYKEFAQSMASQAREVNIDGVFGENKDYLVDTLYNFTLIAGEYIYNSEDLDYDVDTAEFVAQLVAEWTFHKTVDLIHSEVPKEFWDGVLQKVAYTIFEIAKEGLKREMEQKEILPAVETHVEKSFSNALTDLVEREVISKEIKQHAESLNNIEEMAMNLAKKSEKEAAAQVLKTTQDGIVSQNKILNFALKMSKFFEKFKRNDSNSEHNTFFFVFKIIIYACCIWILSTQKIDMHIFVVMLLIAFCIREIIIKIKVKKIEKQFEDVSNIIQQHEDVYNKLQEFTDPKKQYEKLGVDVLEIRINESLIPLADPDKKGQLLTKVCAMRDRLAEDLGYILPKIRVRDFSELKENEYAIYIRNSLVSKGCVYPDRLMMLSDEWDKNFEKHPKDVIYGVESVYKGQAYWVKEGDIDKKDDMQIVKADDVIIKHLETICIEHVEKIMTIDDVETYLKLAKSQSLQYEKIIDDVILNRLSVFDVQKIFVNLIREKISVKDVMRVFEDIAKFSENTTNPYIIAELIRADFGRQICRANCDKDGMLPVITLSKDWEALLDERLEETEYGWMFLLNPIQVQELVATTAYKLMTARNEIGRQPIVLCSPKIRLPLYELLVRHIPTIVVVSYNELITDIKVECYGTVEKE